MLATFAIAFSACNDDDVTVTPAPDPEVVTDGADRVSVFSLNNAAVQAPDTVNHLRFTLIPQGSGCTQDFYGHAEVVGRRLDCRMRIPEGSELPDGSYVMVVAYRYGGPALGARFVVGFEDAVLREIIAETPSYRGLEGDGTSSSPYLVGSTDDFMSLLNNLRRDSVASGAGLWFSQTADFRAPVQSSITDGRGFYGMRFAGHYDGGGHAIEGLYYMGNNNPSKDYNIGLFSKLGSGATVKDLKLANVSISNVFGNAGALCGTSEGNVTISNVKMTGFISAGGDNIGGLIGLVYGDLTVDGYDFGGTVNGSYSVGGLAGRTYVSVPVASMHVENVTTSTHQFSVNGSNVIGGLIGNCGHNVTFKNINLVHSVSSEDSDIAIISAMGGSVGGLVGSGQSAEKLRLENVNVECPIKGGGESVGGCFGYLEIKADMEIDGCTVKSIVKGKNRVGGFAGTLKNKKINFGKPFSILVNVGAASVQGNDEVGGFAGYALNTGIYRSDAGVGVRLAANVSGDGKSVGGMYGSLTDGLIDMDAVEVNPTMRVNGTANVGGLVGEMHSTIVDGFDLPSYHGGTRLPDSGEFADAYSCVVIGDTNVGGLVGYSTGINCIRNLGCKSSVTNSGDYTGGIVGRVESDRDQIRGVVFAGTVSSAGAYTGGIAGNINVKSWVDINNMLNFGSVKGSESTGGVVGYFGVNYDVETFWCVNAGDVNGSGSTGGVIGTLEGSKSCKIGNLANYGNIESEGSGAQVATGGVVGRAPSQHTTIYDATNFGKVYANGAPHGVGGIVGALGHDPSGASFYCSDNGKLYWAANFGEVGASGAGCNVGGIVGWLEEGYSGGEDSIVHDCYNAGDVTSDQNADNGGIVGLVDHFGCVKRCVNYGKVSYGNAMIGTRKEGVIFYHDHLIMLKDSGKEWCADTKLEESELGDASKYSGLVFGKDGWQISGGRATLSANSFQNVAKPK